VAPPVERALLEEAIELATEAGRLTLDWFGSSRLAVERKSDGTPVTAADRAAERFLREQLAERHPDDGILGEEEGASAGTSGRRWIIDPIDGTKAFTRSVPLFSNLLALEDEHGPAVGVINLPALGETVAAGRGLGCWCNGEPAHVSDRSQPTSACLTTSGFSHWEDDALLSVKHAGFSLRTWGDAYGYALVATGRVDVMIDPVVAYWDVAPMLVILSEAGGHFTDWKGRVTADGGNGVATNGVLHDEVLRLLNAGD
jgi:histidinol phosphatase-like enzyme (inositol monophosphatase family)